LLLDNRRLGLGHKNETTFSQAL